MRSLNTRYGTDDGLNCGSTVPIASTGSVICDLVKHKKAKMRTNFSIIFLIQFIYNEVEQKSQFLNLFRLYPTLKEEYKISESIL